MKCVATGQETNMLTKNLPLSREGRILIKEKHTEYNTLLKSKFVEEQMKLNNNLATKEHLEKIAPKISKNAFLKMVGNDSVEGVFKKLEDLEKKDEA